MAKKRGKKQGGISMPDLSDVDGKFVLVPEGRYNVKVTKIEEGEGDKGPYLWWYFKIVSGKSKGQSLRYVTSFATAALFNLRGLLEVLQYEIPEGEFNVTVEDVEDVEFTVEVEHETRDDKEYAKVVDYMPASDEDNKDDDNVTVEDDEDNGDNEGDGKGNGYTEEEVDEMTGKELAAVVEEHELDINLKKEKGLDNKREAVLKALQENDLITGDTKGDGDEDITYTEDEINEMDADELVEVVEAHDLDVNLKKIKKLSKKHEAIIEALTEENLMGDDEGYTEDEINDMKGRELEELLEKHDLEDEVDLSKIKKLPKKCAAVIKVLEKADLIVEED